MFPHFTLFTKKKIEGHRSTRQKRLAVGVSSTRKMLPEEYGTTIEVDLVAEATAKAMRDAGISDASDVHSVQMKTPSMTPARVDDAQQRGKKVCNSNLLTASGMTRGAAAIGAAITLGEIDRARVTDGSIGTDSNLYTSIGCASAGAEQLGVRVIVIGNAEGAPGSLIAAHGMMQHQLDLSGAIQAFANAGLETSGGALTEKSRDRLRAVFCKAGADAVSNIDGRRHTMRSDFLSAFSGHQAKAVVHAILSSISGTTQVLANAGPEHQGPPGANLICIIAESN